MQPLTHIAKSLRLTPTAKALGISATPVREAFQILARDGLIELAQNRGAVVLGVNAKNIREHYEIRAALESEACRLACEKGANLAEIEKCVGGRVSQWESGRPVISMRRNFWLAQSM